MIISAAQPALTFLVKHRDTLFTRVPVVAHGAIDQRILEEVSDPRIVGVPNPPLFTGTIELALRLHPRAQEIAVVAGAAPRDRVFADAARRALQPFQERLRVRWLTNRSMADLKAELGSLPDHTVVLYLTFFADESGNSFLPRQALEEFAPASKAPIYGDFDTMSGRGRSEARPLPSKRWGARPPKWGCASWPGWSRRPRFAASDMSRRPFSIGVNFSGLESARRRFRPVA